MLFHVWWKAVSAKIALFRKSAANEEGFLLYLFQKQPIPQSYAPQSPPFPRPRAAGGSRMRHKTGP
jgi:hypothetical protein